MTLAERREARAKLVADMRVINDLVLKETRAFTPDEETKYTALEADVDKADDEIAAEEKRLQRADKLKELEAGLAAAPPPASKPTPGGHKPQPAEGRSTPLDKAFAFLPAAYRSEEYREAFVMALQGDKHGAQKRADTLQVGLFNKGGALQPPQQFIAELLQALDDAVFARQHARKFRLEKAESLGVPVLDTDIADADWTTELLTGDLGDLTFGKRELRPHPMAKRVKISKTLSRVSAIPMDSLIRERLTYKFGVTEEKAFLTGDGFQKPLGVFTASADGIPTTQDVSTDNTTTEITADGLIEAKHFMKAAYWPRARWIFHRTAIKKVRKLKDGNGQYLWMPGLSGGGMASTILDIPYDISEFAPSTFTTGLYVGALASWNFYWIADALDMTVQVLGELYAETNQDGYIGRKETDGMPVLAEAFVRVKLA